MVLLLLSEPLLSGVFVGAAVACSVCCGSLVVCCGALDVSAGDGVSVAFTFGCSVPVAGVSGCFVSSPVTGDGEGEAVSLAFFTVSAFITLHPSADTSDCVSALSNNNTSSSPPLK